MRRRRALVVVPVAGLVIGAAAWRGTEDMRRYDGLQVVSGWVEEGENAVGLSGETERHVPFERGGTFRFGFQLYNEGNETVRITGLDQDRDESLIRTAEVVTAPMPTGSAVPPDHPSAFEPFSLDPGQSQWIEYQYGFVDCEGPHQGTSTTFRQRLVRFKVGPFAQKVLLALPTPVVITDTPGICDGA